MKLSEKLSHSLIALGIGAVGVLFVLYAWHLPPFDSATVRTENAYVRGRVTTIAPQLSGYVTEVPVQDFQQVKQGDVLARLDDRKYKEAVKQAEATLATARANLDSNAQSIRSAQATVKAKQAALASAQAAQDTAQSSWDRYAKLKEHDVVSVSSYDEVELTLAQAKATVDQARAAVAVAEESVKSAQVTTSTLQSSITSAEAALELAKIDLENTVVRAPEDGTLGQVSVRIGQYVSAGTTLVSEVSPQTWVIANFKETQVEGLHIGQSVSFTVDAMAGQRFSGHLESFSPATGSEFSVLSSSNATGNFTKVAQRLPLRISIDPQQAGMDALRPGMSVVVEAERGARS